MKIAYLRGRKLHGKAVQLPSGYYGSVAERGDTKREIPREEELDANGDVEDAAELVEVAPLQAKACFDEFVVWGHESTADAATDPFVRSIEEWVSFAEQVRRPFARPFHCLPCALTGGLARYTRTLHLKAIRSRHAWMVRKKLFASRRRSGVLNPIRERGT